MVKLYILCVKVELNPIFLSIAVITSAFARVRAESEVSAFTAKKIGYPVLQSTEGHNDDIIWTFENPPEELGKGVTGLKLRWWIERLVQNRLFFYFGGFLVLMDLIFMCLRSFNASESKLELLGKEKRKSALIILQILTAF